MKTQDNKTILIEISENQSVFNANISLSDSKIFFETINTDSTVSLFEKNVITSFDLSKKNIIMENSDKNILDFFSYENFENANLIKIETENENSIYYYNFYDNILLISFTLAFNSFPVDLTFIFTVFFNYTFLTFRFFWFAD